MKIILLRSMVEVPCYICNVNSIVTYWLYKKCSEFNAEDIFEHGVSLLGADRSLYIDETITFYRPSMCIMKLNISKKRALSLFTSCPFNQRTEPQQ